MPSLDIGVNCSCRGLDRRGGTYNTSDKFSAQKNGVIFQYTSHPEWCNLIVTLYPHCSVEPIAESDPASLLRYGNCDRIPKRAQ